MKFTTVDLRSPGVILPEGGLLAGARDFPEHGFNAICFQFTTASRSRRWKRA
jgi:hypothetical protein